MNILLSMKDFAKQNKKRPYTHTFILYEYINRIKKRIKELLRNVAVISKLT